MRKLIPLLVMLAIFGLSIYFTITLIKQNVTWLFITIPVMCGTFMFIIFISGSILASFTVPRAKHIPPASKAHLEKLLFGITAKNSPIEITKKDNIITFSWKLADAHWYEFFSRNELKENYTLQIRLDEKHTKAYAIETTRAYTHKKGFSLPVFLFYISNITFFRGWTFVNIKKEKAWGMKNIFPLTVGKIYEIDFSARMFRAPVLKIITDNGWKVVPCSLSLKLGF